MAVNVAAAPKEFDCDKCKYFKHCTPENPGSFPQWEIDGAHFNVCPKGLVTRDSAEWLRYYSHFSKGIMPVSGGLLENTAKFVEAMEIIEIAKAGL